MGVPPHDLLLGHDQLQESGAFLGLFKFFSHRFLGFRHRTPDAMTLALELTDTDAGAWKLWHYWLLRA